MWTIGLRAEDPRAYVPCLWRGKQLFGEELSAVREATRGSETGLAHPVYPGITLSDEPWLLEVNLARSNGPPAVAGHYLINMWPQTGIRLMKEHVVASERQVLPLTVSQTSSRATSSGSRTSHFCASR